MVTRCTIWIALYCAGTENIAFSRFNEHLTTSPVASCIILMVYKVKVVNIYIDASTSIAEMESETDSRPQQ